VKGDAYEGLLQKNAADVKGGAGQYFTPRALIAALVDVMAPQPNQTIWDPACGTGGFLLAAHDYLAKHHALDREQKKRLRNGTLFGIELVDSVTRLCAMNLLLHGIGGDSETDLPVVTKDALAGKHGEYDLVLANPPFGKKSSVTIVNEAGEQQKESLIINRLRLPTGIFYAQGVKANVLFFDRKPARKKPWTATGYSADYPLLMLPRATAKSFTEVSAYPSIHGPKDGPLLGMNGFQEMRTVRAE